jgi:hypothetical protein
VLLDRRSVFLVQQMKVHAAIFDRRIELHAERLLADLQHAFPDRSSGHAAHSRSA